MPFPKRHASLSKQLVSVFCAALLAVPVISGAVALGEVDVHSAMGQALDADIEISALSPVEAESLAVRLAPPEAFANAGLDYTPTLRSLRLSVEKKGDRQVIHLSSDLAVSDPFLILLIEINANGNRTTRQYSLLLDPPAVGDEPRISRIEPPVVAPPPVAGSPVKRAPEPAVQIPVAQPGKALPSLTVKAGDTLVKVAQRMPSHTGSLDQVLIALLRTNPDAFAGNNIHRIKAGSVLRAPDEASIHTINPVDAHQQVLLQTQDFHRYRSSLAAAIHASAKTPEPAVDTANRSSSGPVGVQQQATGPAPDAPDQLKLSAPQDSSGKGETPGGAALKQIATDKALTEANSRIAALEKNISDMQQQLALKNQSLALAQQRADSPAGAANAATDSAPDTAKPRDVPAKPAKPVKPASTRENEPDVVTRLSRVVDQAAADPQPWLSGLGTVIAGISLLWLRARLRRRRAPVERVEPKASTQMLFGEAGGRNVDTSNSVFHSNFVPSVSQLDTNEVDAVAEADVYIAYGRDEQAEEILLDALKQHPDRQTLRVKLLEIYAARKDSRKFGVLASELRVLTHGHGPDWMAAAAMGRALDPGNLLYGEPLNTSPGVPSPPDSSLAETSAVDDFEIKLEGLLDERRKEHSKEQSQSSERLSVGSQSARLPAQHEAPAPALMDFQLAGLGDSPIPESEQIALKTKIDLALACQEIGDKDGARELLTEVAGAPHSELARRAQSLLQQLA